MTGQLVWDFGPAAIPGVSVVVGNMASFGLFIKGVLSVGLSASLADDKCKDETCWAGSGQIGLQAVVSGGGFIYDPLDTTKKTPLLEATINGISGIQGQLTVECLNKADSHTKTEGQWDGIAVSIIFDLFDGFFHFEAGSVVVQPQPFGPGKTPMPSII